MNGILKHTLNKIGRLSRILIVDGDQNMLRPENRQGVLNMFSEVHIFRNFHSTTHQPDHDLGWCRYHSIEETHQEKEAVDHFITFFCGERARDWSKNRMTITIVSRDKSFNNTKYLLERRGVRCEIKPTVHSLNIGNQKTRWKRLNKNV